MLKEKKNRNGSTFRIVIILEQLSSIILWDGLIKNLPDVHKTQSTYIR